MIAQRQLTKPRSRPSSPAGPRLRAVSVPRPQRRLTPFVLVVAAVVGALVFGVVALQAIVAETSFRLQDLAQRGVELRQEQGELRLQIAELSSPRRITKRARDLGLYFPEGVKTLRVRSTEEGGEGAGQAATAPPKGGGSP